jgi:N-methylhydantoinase A/oxoprolinase/acetone carboxylase beta subunit
MLEIAVDIGGTFTDIVCWQDQQRLCLAKDPPTPHDLVQGVQQGVARVLALAGQPATALERFIHSTTIATHAILERKGAITGVLMTAGFEVVLAEALSAMGLRATLQVMQSRGGLRSVRTATDRPVMLLLSGPAAGVIGGRFAGEQSHLRDLITLDIGGTSCDVGLSRLSLSGRRRWQSPPYPAHSLRHYGH